MATDLARSLEIVTRTDAGRVRPHNEDAVFGDAAAGLVILADGMGGYNAGEMASGLATMMLRTALPKALAAGGKVSPGAVLPAEIGLVNAAILRAAESQPRYAGMGTTLVVAVFRDDQMTVAHVGDSRLYRWRNGELRLLTRDHSVLREQLDSGIITAEQARQSRNRNLLTRALGVDPVVEPELAEHAVEPGDVYLLCSDGLNDMVEDGDIAAMLVSQSERLAACAAELVRAANDRGGRDNVSVALVRVGQVFPARRSWWVRFLAWFK
ncbi:MAG: Stp1/IreP family PP2C-type Ser/Thr phosphatase [Rhodocyclaceae bacterium]|nr:Stp1/IreP family PP2C-type Ser/Thr phosphatase [Rhodocyclaceae bacterium]